MTQQTPPIPATDPAERARLRELVRRRDDLKSSGKSYMSEYELHMTLHRLGQRLEAAQEAAVRSNRAKGLVRELTMQREQLIANVQQQRIEIHGIQVEGDRAEQRLLAGAPPAMLAEIANAQAEVVEAEKMQSRCNKATPLRDRIDADYQVYTARNTHQHAVQAAIDWAGETAAAQE